MKEAEMWTSKGRARALLRQNFMLLKEKPQACRRSLKINVCQVVVVGGRGRWICEFEASLVCRMNSRTARTVWKKFIGLSGNLKKKKKFNMAIGLGLLNNKAWETQESESVHSGTCTLKVHILLYKQEATTAQLKTREPKIGQAF